MKKTTLIISIIFGAALTAAAQETIPVAEVGFNYSFLRQNPGGSTSGFMAQGGSGTAAYNINRMFGVVADFGVYTNGGAGNLNPTTFTYLFGPRYSLRTSSRFTPYVQALVGGARVSTSFLDANSNSVSATDNGFAAAFGGGLDVRLTDSIAIKPFQVEYLLTDLPNVWSTGTTQNNLRYTAGVVFRFGSK
jgi:opacity protein-like surface antigen